jgi:hypothetical protein
VSSYRFESRNRGASRRFEACEGLVSFQRCFSDSLPTSSFDHVVEISDAVEIGDSSSVVSRGVVVVGRRAVGAPVGGPGSCLDDPCGHVAR